MAATRIAIKSLAGSVHKLIHLYVLLTAEMVTESILLNSVMTELKLITKDVWLIVQGQLTVGFVEEDLDLGLTAA